VTVQSLPYSSRGPGWQRRLALGSLCLGCLIVGVLGDASLAQTESYCTVTGVDVNQLSNAVRITIRADGVLQVEAEIFDFVEWSEEEGSWQKRELALIPFVLPNARTRVGSFVDISAYPVSYLAMSTPPESPEGVGLKCLLALYRPATLGRMNVDNDEMDLTHWGEAMDVRVHIEKSTNGRELYLTVTSDKHVEVAKEKPEREPKELERRLSLKKGPSGALSLRALNADLQEVMQQISQLSGVPVLVDDAVEHDLTCCLDDMQVDALLHSIARGCGLALAQEDNTYYVSEALPTNVASYWLSSTETIALRYLKPTEALPLLSDCVLRYARPNEAGNTLVATGPPALLEKIRSDISEVDKPGLQITLRVAVVEFSSDAEATRTLAALVGSGNVQAGVDSADSTLSFAVLDKRLSEIQAQMGWLRRKSTATLDVRPRLTVRSGERAEMFWGQKRYFKFISTGEYGPEVQIETANIGVKLRATPWGSTPDWITVPLEVEASNLLSVGAGGLPIVARRTANVTLALKSGDTVIIGGLELAQPSRGRQRTAPGTMPWPLSEAMTAVQRRSTVRNIVILLQVDAEAL